MALIALGERQTDLVLSQGSRESGGASCRGHPHDEWCNRHHLGSTKERHPFCCGATAALDLYGHSGMSPEQNT